MTETINPLTHPNPLKLWYHRRSIAYASVAGLFLMLILIFVGAIDKDIVPLAQTLCWVFGINILGYIANNVVENVAAMKFGSR